MNTELDKEFLEFLEEKKRKAQEETDRIDALINQAKGNVIAPVQQIQPVQRVEQQTVTMPIVQQVPQQENNEKRQVTDRTALRKAMNDFMIGKDYLTVFQIASGLKYEPKDGEDVHMIVGKMLSAGAIADPAIYHRKKGDKTGDKYTYKFKYPKSEVKKEDGKISYNPNALKYQPVFSGLKSAILAYFEVHDGAATGSIISKYLMKTVEGMLDRHNALLVQSVGSLLNQMYRDNLLKMREYQGVKYYSLFVVEKKSLLSDDNIIHYGQLSWSEVKDLANKYMSNNRLFLTPKEILKSICTQTDTECMKFEPMLISHLDDIHKRNPLIINRRGITGNCEYKLNESSVEAKSNVDMSNHIRYTPGDGHIFKNLKLATIRVAKNSNRLMNVDDFTSVFNSEIPGLPAEHKRKLRQSTVAMLNTLCLSVNGKKPVLEKINEKGIAYYSFLK